MSVNENADPPLLPAASPAASRASRRFRWSTIGVALAVLLSVTALANAGGRSDDAGLETTLEEGELEPESRSPRPSGDDAQRPAPPGRGWVEIGPDVVADVSGRDSRPIDPSTADPPTTDPPTTGSAGRTVRSAAPTRVGTGSAPPTEASGSSPDLSTEESSPVDNPSPAEVDPEEQQVEPDAEASDDHDDRPSIGAYVAPVLSRDQLRCPALDTVAIGDLPDDADAALAAFGPRFRALAPAELVRDELVCAGPIHRWRGLVIQHLFIGQVREGTLAASADGQGEVIRFTEPEWRGYRLLPEDIDIDLGGPTNHRTAHADHTVVHTSKGGLVAQRPDTHGFLVVNGAWTLWNRPDGLTTMGFPETQPAISGTLGIYQDFAHGWLQIPGVVNPFEAQLLGPEAYVWHPISDPHADVPPDARGNILEVNQTSWFIDDDGVRHWIPAKRDYDCARSEHGARKITVRGWVVATFPIGEPFTCPSR